jgi:glycosyltransferase involved in cell wall biosynthesis
MKQKVCMFVWNHFTNDARVLRECTALSENGYKVDLICIHDPHNKSLAKFEQKNENFRVFRVNRYPLAFTWLQNFYRLCKKNKAYAVAFSFVWALLLFFFPIFTILSSVLLLLVIKTKLKVVWFRSSIIVRMIIRGFREHYDIYHSNDLNTLPQGYICSKWRINKKKLVYDSHEVQTSRTGYDHPFYGKLESFLVKRIDSMIVENHTRAKYNEELYGFYPNVVHNYPFKQESIKEAIDLHKILGIPKEEKILLYQGGIQTGRGLDKLIQAFPYFTEGTLVFIGDGKIKPDLIKMVEEMGIQDKVKFLPKVPLEDLPKYTKNAYLGFQVLNNVCFNHYSASSNKLFEYMMAGIPVIACSFPEISKVVKAEKIGVCVDSHDFRSIAEGTNYLLNNRDVHKQMSENALRARNRYNWESEKAAFLRVYETL